MFSFTIQYRKGIKNCNADALSRLPTEPDEDEDKECDEPLIINYIVADCETLNEKQLVNPNLLWFFELKKQAEEENKHHIVVTQFQNQDQRSLYAQWNRVYIIDSTLYRAWATNKNNSNKIIFQYIVPKQQRQEILHAAHDPPHSAHMGILKTQIRIKERYYWPG
jgi:hypothetical protein